MHQSFLGACWLAAAVGLLWSRPVFATEPLVAESQGQTSPAKAPSPPLVSRWYGWEILLADGASILLSSGGVAMAEGGSIPDPMANTFIGLGVATYVLGGPIAHFGHGNPGRGMASLGLRTLMPVALGFLTVRAACDPPGEFCGVLVIPGGLVGIVAAITIDAAALARDEVPARGGSARLLPGFSVSPSIYYDTQRGSIGLVGTF